MRDPDETKRATGFHKAKSEQTPQGESYLLAVGINAYQHFQPLQNATKDAQDFTDLMVNSYGFRKEKQYTYVLLDEQATRANIIHTLSSLCRQVKENDRVLLYYSGHGFLDKYTQRGYWIPVEAERDFEAGYISNSDIRDYIKAMKSRHTLLISDSCFAGSLLVRDATRDVSGAFEDWEGKRSRWLFCSGRGVVSDGKAGTNSPFTAQILRVLGDTRNDKINIGRLADEVITSVRFNYEQQAEACPFFGADHDGGQFIFYRPVSEADREEQAFQSVLAKRNKLELIRFLQATKNKKYKREVRAVLREIEEEEIWKRVNKKSFAALDEFLDDNPNSPFAEEAQKLLDKMLKSMDSGIVQEKATKKEAPKPVEPEKQPEDQVKKVTPKSKRQPKTQVKKEVPKPKVQAEAQVKNEASSQSPTSPAAHKKEGIFIPQMVFVEGGTFLMGSEEEENTKPIHKTTVPSFYIGKYPVTFEEYDQFCNATGRDKPADGYKWLGLFTESYGRGRRPVIRVNYEDALAYCAWLYEKIGNKYYLPSEAEWEFAARGGIYSKGYKYAGGDKLDTVAWFSVNSGGKTHPVGEKEANELGLHDMNGNVWELCADNWHSDYYGAPKDGSVWIGGPKMVVRGGSHFSNPQSVASRMLFEKDDRNSQTGFRLVRRL